MDRVRVLKQESAATGGDDADTVVFPDPIDPSEDALDAAGLFLQTATSSDSSVGMYRVGDALVLKDAVTGEKTLAELAAGGSGSQEVQFRADGYYRVFSDVDPYPVKSPGTITLLRVLRVYAGTGGATQVCLRINGVQASSILTVSGGDNAYEESVESLAIVAGDILSMEISDVESGRPRDLVMIGTVA